MSTAKLIIYFKTENISLNGQTECGEKHFHNSPVWSFRFFFYSLQKGLMVVKTVLTAAPGSGENIVLFNGIFSHGWELFITLVESYFQFENLIS